MLFCFVFVFAGGRKLISATIELSDTEAVEMRAENLTIIFHPNYLRLVTCHRHMSPSHVTHDSETEGLLALLRSELSISSFAV